MRQFKIHKSITNRQGSALEYYLKDIARFNVLTPEQEVHLAQRIHKGDDEALLRLVSANLRFVVSVAKAYQSSGLQLIDLINEGNLGLIKAAQRFDETKGFKFITYAVWWIRQSIIQGIAESSFQIRLPLNKVGLLNRVVKSESGFTIKYEREPTDDEIALVMNESLEDIVEVKRFENILVSLDEPMNDPEGEIYLDTVVQLHTLLPDAYAFEQVSLQQDLNTVLQLLKPREQEVIRLVFGIGTGCEPMNLEQVASRIGGLTRERARQIKNKALEKLAENKQAQEKLVRYFSYQ